MCAICGLRVLHLEELVLSYVHSISTQEVMSSSSWSIQHAIYSMTAP